VTYLVSEPFAPNREHGINPMDPALALPWPADITPLLSDKDVAAPSLAEAEASGLLPRYDDCVAFYALQRASR
jgi:dTDP-4-dehydrorhamnose 3,5-epimerase